MATPPLSPLRLLLFTDTLGDINGVSRFIRNAAGEALATSRNLTILTSTRFDVPQQSNIINIPPPAACTMPGYSNLELVLPPFRALLRAARAFRPDVIHVSTPGPVGLCGALAARRLRVPLAGVYHTDFPAYIERLFAHDSLTLACETYMRRFYRRFAAVFTRSEDYADRLVRLGLNRDRIHALRPGIVLEQFHPRFRDETIYQRNGCMPGAVRILYCGRVSVEKNLPLLTRVWPLADARLREANIPAELVIVGDGPYLAQMRGELSNTHARFLGFRHGPELSALYASADLFLFPSTTDTLGQVVMEAQASGLPVLVTDKGGPQQVVRDGETGYILPAHDTAAWTNRILTLACDEKLRQRLSAAAHASMQPFSMAASFDHFWRVHEQVRATGSRLREPVL